jgi:hypothetical protein
MPNHDGWGMSQKAKASIDRVGVGVRVEVGVKAEVRV